MATEVKHAHDGKPDSDYTVEQMIEMSKNANSEDDAIADNPEKSRHFLPESRVLEESPQHKKMWRTMPLTVRCSDGDAEVSLWTLSFSNFLFDLLGLSKEFGQQEYEALDKTLDLQCMFPDEMKLKFPCKKEFFELTDRFYFGYGEFVGYKPIVPDDWCDCALPLPKYDTIEELAEKAKVVTVRNQIWFKQFTYFLHYLGFEEYKDIVLPECVGHMFNSDEKSGAKTRGGELIKPEDYLRYAFFVDLEKYKDLIESNLVNPLFPEECKDSDKEWRYADNNVEGLDDCGCHDYPRKWNNYRL